MIINFRAAFIAAMALVLVLAPGCSPSNPLETLKKELEPFPQYSVILNDMRVDGNFFKDYYHQYKIVRAQKANNSDSLVFETEISDFYEVPKDIYNKYQLNLGMTVLARGPKGEVSTTAQPPGYQYVGNPQYGRWTTTSSGDSFWEWYGKYALISTMFNMASGPIFQRDYHDYRSNYSAGRTYYGRNNMYGTNGKYTKQNNKSFFERKAAREAARKSRFSQRSRSKMSGYRGRSGGFGK